MISSNNTNATTPDNSYRRWFLVALFSTCALFFAELFEQIVFVPNWLIGDVPKNVLHFRGFKHVADPGMYYGPFAILAILSHVVLLRAKDAFSAEQKKAILSSLVAFLIVLGVTAYVIATINVPIFDKGLVPNEQLTSKLTLWASLNMLRIVLPGYALYKLVSLLKFKDS